MKSLTLTLCALVVSALPGTAATIFYSVIMNGPNESPANASPGTGTGKVTFDTVLNTMRVQATFTGLTGNTTASHIHAATAVAGTGTAGVATTLPTFTGFPLGVTSGIYDNTFDLTLASSYNSAYVTANGGTTASAEAALELAAASGKAYLNIHTSTFGGGEIRGFLTPDASVPEPATLLLSGLALAGFGLLRRRLA